MNDDAQFDSNDSDNSLESGSEVNLPNVEMKNSKMGMEDFFSELQRWELLLEDMSNAQPRDRMMLVYIVHDIASHKDVFWSKEEAFKRGFSDENGNITKNAKIFSNEMIYLAEDKINYRVRKMDEVITNFDEVGSALNNLARSVPYEMNDEVINSILAYSHGNPGVLNGLREAAIRNKWTTLDEIQNFVGYGIDESTVEKAVSELWDKKFRKK